MIKVTFPKGTFYIGDPCFITKGEEGYKWYEKVLDLHYNHNNGNGIIDVDNVLMFMQNTYEGDGVFDSFYVDSGLIAIIKIDNLINDSRFNWKNMTIKGAKFAKFENEISITYDEGLFNINDEFIINTKEF